MKTAALLVLGLVAWCVTALEIRELVHIGSLRIDSPPDSLGIELVIWGGSALPFLVVIGYLVLCARVDLNAPRVRVVINGIRCGACLVLAALGAAGTPRPLLEWIPVLVLLAMALVLAWECLKTIRTLARQAT